MIYFFHHYELPVIIQQAQVQQILRLRTRQRHQQQNGNGAPGAANNPSNQRNSPDIATQANNDGMANNQMNNNNNNSNNNTNRNNVNNNNNNSNLLGNISVFFNLQTASLLINHAMNAMGTLQNLLANDIFGTATFFNNNNDNNLNNNNNSNNNNNNARVNITRLRINLNQLRRINLAGIQINPNENGDNIRADGGNVSDGATDIGAAATTSTPANTSDGYNEAAAEASMAAAATTPTIVDSNHDVPVDSAISFQHQFGNNSSATEYNDSEANLNCNDDNLKQQLQSIATNEFDVISVQEASEIKQNAKLNDDGEEAAARLKLAHYSRFLGALNKHHVESSENDERERTNCATSIASDGSRCAILVNNRENFEKSICAAAEIECDEKIGGSDNNERYTMNQIADKCRQNGEESDKIQLPIDMKCIATEMSTQYDAELDGNGDYSSRTEQQVHSQYVDFSQSFSIENCNRKQSDTGNSSVVDGDNVSCTNIQENELPAPSISQNNLEKFNSNFGQNNHTNINADATPCSKANQ